MKKAAVLTTASFLVSSLFLSSAYAFNDVEGGQQKAISALQTRGIVSGIDSEHFAPKIELNYAEAVRIIVKAFDLNLDALRLFKLPLASDFYPDVKNDAWYSNSFIIAHFNGVDIPKDVIPGATITREQFAKMLIPALERKYKLPMINLSVGVKDQDQITPELQGAVLRLIHYRIAELDKEGNFLPKNKLTRGEAATWVYNALNVPSAQKPPASEKVTVAIEKMSDYVNKVTLSRGSKPNAGYGLEIGSIRFDEDGRAVVSYKLIDPQPDQMYPDVITEPKAVTYLSSKYTVTIEPAL